MKFRHLYSNQLTLENTLENYAKATQQKSVILCDRGIMDGSAYVSKEEWNKLLHEEGLNHLSASVERYNAVFHLVTAADGASQHYTLEVCHNNLHPFDYCFFFRNSTCCANIILIKFRIIRRGVRVPMKQSK